MSPISENDPRPQPKILGAKPITDAQPKILDQKSRQAAQPIEVRVHEEHIVESDKIRSDPNAPEIRVRAADTKAFDKVKRLEDE